MCVGASLAVFPSDDVVGEGGSTISHGSASLGLVVAFGRVGRSLR